MTQYLKLIRKSLIYILFVILTSVLFLFSGITTFAATTCNAEYLENIQTKTVNLDYGIKYNSAQGRSRYTANGTFVDQVCNYIEVPSSESIFITSWSKFQNKAWTRSKLVDIAKDFEKNHPGYRVIAITNGDFYDINGANNFPYSPTGTLICDGNYYKTTPTRHTGYKVVSFNNDGSTNPITSYDQSVVNVKSLPTLTIYDELGNVIKSVAINKVNEEPSDNEIAAFYGSYNKDKKYVQIETSISAKKTFVVSDPINYLPNKANDFFGLGCISSVGSKVLLSGEFAISSNNEELNTVLKEGVKIRVQYDWEGEAGNVVNALNAGTQILVNGEAPSNVNTADGSRMNARHPRTAIGVREDGTIVLMVNDGRQEKIGRYGSYGNELAAMMKYYGCVNAFNLDGGGSSIMYYRDGDNFVLGNKYSDASERIVSNAVVVAVKDPAIKVSFDTIGSKNVDISVEVLDNNSHDITELIATIGNKTAKIENGKATLTGLTPLTGYEIRLSYVNSKGVEYKLPEKYPFGTTAREYRFDGIDIKKENNNYLFTLQYVDRGNATTLKDAIIKINGKEYQMADGKVSISIDEIKIINEIIVIFENQVYDGYATVTLVNPHAPYLNTLNYAYANINTYLNEIFN